MTKVAINTERCVEDIHDLAQLIGGNIVEHLDVLKTLADRRTLRRRRLRLRQRAIHNKYKTRESDRESDDTEFDRVLHIETYSEITASGGATFIKSQCVKNATPKPTNHP
jgi:hypothetical protein